MLSKIDHHVLDAVAHSLEFEVFSISSATGREIVHGIKWDTLQRITGLSEDTLDASTGRLLSMGMIDCGGTPHILFGWRLGRRSSSFFWATNEARRLIAEQDRQSETGDVGNGVLEMILPAGGEFEWGAEAYL
jgi:hypothetical protein